MQRKMKLLRYASLSNQGSRTYESEVVPWVSEHRGGREDDPASPRKKPGAISAADPGTRTQLAAPAMASPSPFCARNHGTTSAAPCAAPFPRAPRQPIVALLVLFAVAASGGLPPHPPARTPSTPSTPKTFSCRTVRPGDHYATPVLPVRQLRHHFGPPLSRYLRAVPPHTRCLVCSTW